MTPENPNALPFSAEYGHPAACGGMTLRDWFAGQVLGFAVTRDYGNDWGKLGKEHLPKSAKWAYQAADAMLAERAKVRS